MGTGSIQRTIIGEVLVFPFIVALWIPSSATFSLWGTILGTFLFTLLGAAWYIINTRYPQVLSWMQDEQKVDRVMEIAAGILAPAMLAGLDFLFWAMLQRSVSHPLLLAGMIAINLGLLLWEALNLIFPSISEGSIPVPFFFAVLLAIVIFAAWLAFPSLLAGGCTVIVVIAYAAFLVWYRRWEVRQAALFDFDTPVVVRDLDEQTAAFL